jgi:hypothetical protein
VLRLVKQKAVAKFIPPLFFSQRDLLRAQMAAQLFETL